MWDLLAAEQGFPYKDLGKWNIEQVWHFQYKGSANARDAPTNAMDAFIKMGAANGTLKWKSHGCVEAKVTGIRRR